MLKKIYYFRIFLWLILASFVVFVIWQTVVPYGEAVYEFNFKKSSFFIGRLRPRERVSEIAEGRQTIIGQPVYFNLWTPRPFSKLKLTIRYKSQQTPLFEVGLLTDKQTSAYYLQPLNNEILNELYDSKNWGLIQEGPIILLQKEEAYTSVQDFLKHLPATSSVAVYNYSLLGGPYKKVNAEFVMNSKIKYIIGNYRLPKTIDDWQEATVEFDLTRAERTKDGYGLMLSAPFLAEGGIELGLIKAELTGQKLSDVFKIK